MASLSGRKEGTFASASFQRLSSRVPWLFTHLSVKVTIAADHMRGGELDHVGILAAALLHLHLAAILEVAVVRHIDGVRHLAGDGVQLIHLLAHHGLGGHQADGVGVGGIGEDLLHRTLLNPTSFFT